MKIVIPSQYTLLVLDKLQFVPLPKLNEFAKPVQDGHYPRLHAITKEAGSETLIDIHLDLEKHKNAIQNSHLIRETIKKIKEYVLA
jgi:hypothetical protein